MLRLFALLMTFTLTVIALPAKAQHTSGDFDYYVLALSWSPTWCALEGDDRGSPQCDADKDFGWVLHGLVAAIRGRLARRLPPFLPQPIAQRNRRHG